jgi:hypothetical protein
MIAKHGESQKALKQKAGDFSIAIKLTNSAHTADVAGR